MHLESRRLHVRALRASISADRQTLLVVARGLIVGVDRDVRGETLSRSDLSPAVDRVNIPKLICVVNAVGQHGGGGGLQGHELADVLEPATMQMSDTNWIPAEGYRCDDCQSTMQIITIPLLEYDRNPNI